jgi:hypothetical protein
MSTTCCPTPPISSYGVRPVYGLSRPTAQFAWASVKLLLVCLVFALATGMVARTGVRLTTPAILLMVSGWWLAVVVDVQEGQTNFLALLPLIAGLADRAAGVTAARHPGGRTHRPRRRRESDPAGVRGVFRVEAPLDRRGQRSPRRCRVLAVRAGARVRMGPEPEVARAVGANHDSCRTRRAARSSTRRANRSAASRYACSAMCRRSKRTATEASKHIS